MSPNKAAHQKVESLMPNVVGEHRCASRDRYSPTALTSLQLRVLMEISGDCLIISTRGI